MHDDRFEVELSFDNIPEKLVIPFDAVKGFLDPAVQFGLQFETRRRVESQREVEAAEARRRQAEPTPTAPDSERRSARSRQPEDRLTRFRSARNEAHAQAPLPP